MKKEKFTIITITNLSFKNKIRAILGLPLLDIKLKLKTIKKLERFYEK